MRLLHWAEFLGMACSSRYPQGVAIDQQRCVGMDLTLVAPLHRYRVTLSSTERRSAGLMGGGGDRNEVLGSSFPAMRIGKL